MQTTVILKSRYRNQACILPRHHFEALAAIIYQKISLADADYAKFLHDKGFEHNSNYFKLFNFSPITNHKNAFTTYKDKIIFTQFPLSFKLNSLVPETTENFILGTFKDRNITFAGKGYRTQLFVDEIIKEKPPVFSNEMHYRTVSPVVLKKNKKFILPGGLSTFPSPKGTLESGFHANLETSNRLSNVYENYKQALTQNLLQKHNASLEVLKFRNSEIQNLKTSELQNFKISELQNFKISELQNFKTPEFKSLMQLFDY